MNIFHGLIIAGVIVIGWIFKKRYDENKDLNSPKTLEMTEKAISACHELERIQKDYIIRRFQDEFLMQNREVYKFFTRYPYTKIKSENVGSGVKIGSFSTAKATISPPV